MGNDYNSAPPIPVEELRHYLRTNAAALPREHGAVATALERLADEAEQYYANLDSLEQHLTALEEQMITALRARQREEALIEVRRELDSQLRPYIGKMTAEQLAMLEQHLVERNLLEQARLPRLSLFYLP
jgi:hypothetical protein